MSSTKANRLNETRRHFQLNLAGDGGLANTLRIRDGIFNADVLPRDPELMAPSDFYAAIVLGSLRVPKRARKQTTEEGGASLFPYLTA